jgi:hypothetical protein
MRHCKVTLPLAAPVSLALPHQRRDPAHSVQPAVLIAALAAAMRQLSLF